MSDKLAPEAFIKSIECDPLFAAEGMDIDRALFALNFAKNVIYEIEEAVSNSSFLGKIFILRYPILRYQIPLSFIESFIHCEQRRRLFISNPTVAEGNRLVESWRMSQKNLEKGIRRFSKIHNILSALAGIFSKNPYQDMHGNITYPEDFEKQVTLLKKNSYILKKEIDLREKLLWKESLEFQNPVSRDRRLWYTEGLIQPEHEKIHKLELKYGFQFRHGEIKESHGPFVYTVKNFDGKLTPHNFMLYFLRNRESGVESLKAIAVDVFNFLKIEKTPKKDPHMRTHAYIADTGMSYWYQCATNLYTARDQRYLADIATIIDLKRRPSLNSELVLSQKSSLLDLILGLCAEELRTTRDNLKEYLYQDVFSVRHAFNLFMARAYPSIYFLPFNHSVWRIEENPDFLGSGRVKEGDIIYEKSDSVLRKITPEQLELAMKGGFIREQKRREAWAI